MHDSDFRPWYALIACAASGEREGRVLLELVNLQASESAMYAAVRSMNELARLTMPFSFDKQLAKLGGAGWNQADVGHIFYRATQDEEFQKRFSYQSARMHPGMLLPSPAEAIFDEAVQQAWRVWDERMAKALPPRPTELHAPYSDAMQLRLRHDLCELIYVSIEELKEKATERNEGAYLVRNQFEYRPMLDLMVSRAMDFLEKVQEKAAALLESIVEQAE